MKRIVGALLDLALAAPEAAAEAEGFRREAQLGEGVAALGAARGLRVRVGVRVGMVAGIARMAGLLLLLIGAGAATIAAGGRRGAGRRRLGAMLTPSKGGKVFGGQVLVKDIRAIDDPDAHLDGGAAMELLIGFVR